MSNIKLNSFPAQSKNFNANIGITKHAFHIVEASFWPFSVSGGAFFLLFGLTLAMHSYAIGTLLFQFGLCSVVLFSALWWRDIVREATYGGEHTNIVRSGLRYGMVLFIVSELMLFFAFFWAYFHSSVHPTPEIGAVWPPIGIVPLSPWKIPLLNTTLLLTSGAFLTWSHAALVYGNRLEAITGLVFTLILATIFTILQGFEYVNAPFSISDGIYGSTFYMLTGLHGFHVIVGTLFLLAMLIRVVKHHLTKNQHVGYESAAWYWHFVDVVWIFLFFAVYIWGEGV